MTQIEKIDNELKTRGISQKKFCEAVNIKQNTMSTWKKRNGTVSAKYITPICNFFDWPVHEFLNCEEEQENIANENTDDLTLVEEEAYRLLKSLPNGDKLEIMQNIMQRAREYIDNVRE